jgi:hypothetical protein
MQTRKDDDEVCPALVAKVFGQEPIMKLVGSYLHYEDVYNFFRSLPASLQRRWLYHSHLAEWTARRRNKWEAALRIDRSSPFLDLASYLNFNHLHDHTWNTDGPGEEDEDQPLYATSMFRHHPMQPPVRQLHVQACLFLPSKGPAPALAGNLVLLSMMGGGCLTFYAPTLDGFVLTCRVNLECSPHLLACSPGGTALLAAHHNSVWIDVSGPTVRCTFTGIRVDYGSSGMCFASENSFLTSDYKGNVWLHQLEEEDSHSRRRLRAGVRPTVGVTTSLLIDCQSYGTAAWPFNKNIGRGTFHFVYKPASPATTDCLILLSRTYFQGKGTAMRLKFAPRLQRDTSGEDYFIYFNKCIIADVVVHPGNEHIFVVVMTRLNREDFFGNGWRPVVSNVGQLYRPSRPIRATESNRVGVYELQFHDDDQKKVTAVPRFMLDGLSTFTTLHGHGVCSPRKYPMIRPDEQKIIHAQCGNTHLTVALSPLLLVHLPLISTAESEVIHHMMKSTFRVFAFSGDLSFGVVFAEFREQNPALYNVAGLISCVKYQRVNADVRTINGTDCLMSVAKHQHPTY